MPTEDQIQRDIDLMRRTSDARLDRIEQKIDQLSDAMVTLARAEEKLIGIDKSTQTLYERLNRHSEKIDSLELKLENTSKTTAFMTKAIWVLFGTAAATILARLSEIAP